MYLIPYINKIMKITKSKLKELINSTLQEDSEYQIFFKKVLDKFGYDSPADMNDETKKKFFNVIDKGWTAKNEYNKKEEDITEEDVFKVFGKTYPKRTVNESKIKVGSKVIVKDPTSTKVVKGVVGNIIKSTKGNVYALRGGKGTWDEKYLTLDESVNEATFHYNPKKVEPLFKKIKLDVPVYPKTGDVHYNGKVVGYVDNFNGLTIQSKSVVDLLKKYAKQYNIGVWNPDKVTMESVNESKYDLMFSDAGGGITVSNRAVDDPNTRDYKKVAHIHYNGKIEWSDKEAQKNTKVKRDVESHAKRQKENVNESKLPLQLQRIKDEFVRHIRKHNNVGSIAKPLTDKLDIVMLSPRPHHKDWKKYEHSDPALFLTIENTRRKQIVETGVIEFGSFDKTDIENGVDKAMQELVKLVKKSNVNTSESVNESKPHGSKIEALNAFFSDKVTADELKIIADKYFDRPVATKKELQDFISNKFLQGVMADTYDIPVPQLEKKVKELLKAKVYESVNENKNTKYYIEYEGVDDPFGKTIQTFDTFDKKKIEQVFNGAVKKYLKSEGDEIVFAKDDAKYIGDVLLTVELKNGNPMTQIHKGSKTYYKSFKGFK